MRLICIYIMYLAFRTSLAVQRLKTPQFHCREHGLNPWLGSSTCHAVYVIIIIIIK